VAFNLACWLIPLAIDITLLALVDVHSPFCLPRHPFHLFIWGTFIMAGFLWNAILYILVKRRLSVMSKAIPSLKQTPVGTRLSGYMLAFLLCQVPNVVSIIINYVYHHYCNDWWLTEIVLTTLNLTGLANCLVYGVTNRTIRSSYSVLTGIGTFFAAPFLLLPFFLYKIIETRKARKSAQPSDFFSKNEYQPLKDDFDYAKVKRNKAKVNTIQ